MDFAPPSLVTIKPKGVRKYKLYFLRQRYFTSLSGTPEFRSFFLGKRDIIGCPEYGSPVLYIRMISLTPENPNWSTISKGVLTDGKLFAPLYVGEGYTMERLYEGFNGGESWSHTKPSKYPWKLFFVGTPIFSLVWPLQPRPEDDGFGSDSFVGLGGMGQGNRAALEGLVIEELRAKGHKLFYNDSRKSKIKKPAKTLLDCSRLILRDLTELGVL